MREKLTSLNLVIRHEDHTYNSVPTVLLPFENLKRFETQTRGIVDIPKLLGGLGGQLTYLGLSSCKLTATDLEFLASKSNLHNLAELDIGNNKLRKVWPAFKSFLSKLNRLRMLQLETSDLDPEKLEEFLETLRASNPMLQLFDVINGGDSTRYCELSFEVFNNVFLSNLYTLKNLSAAKVGYFVPNYDQETEFSPELKKGLVEERKNKGYPQLHLKLDRFMYRMNEDEDDVFLPDWHQF